MVPATFSRGTPVAARDTGMRGGKGVGPPALSDRTTAVSNEYGPACNSGVGTDQIAAVGVVGWGASRRGRPVASPARGGLIYDAARQSGSLPAVRSAIR